MSFLGTATATSMWGPTGWSSNIPVYQFKADFSDSQSVTVNCDQDVGTEATDYPAGGLHTLQLAVADVDGDGWLDIAASFEAPSGGSSSSSYYKRLYYGKRDGAVSTSAAAASWPRTDGTRFGPEADDLHAHLDMRVAQGRYAPGRKVEGGMSDDGRVVLWGRLRNGAPIDAATLAVINDFVPSGTSHALGLPAGATSLDNTLRVRRIPESEWVCCDIQIEGVHNGFVHGRVAMFADSGELMVITGQACEDNGAPADCEFTYIVSQDALSITKRVDPEGEGEAFRRNRYVFTR